jgi:hypothetical protein
MNAAMPSTMGFIESKRYLSLAVMEEGVVVISEDKHSLGFQICQQRDAKKLKNNNKC